MEELNFVIFVNESWKPFLRDWNISVKFPLHFSCLTCHLMDLVISTRLFLETPNLKASFY